MAGRMRKAGRRSGQKKLSQSVGRLACGSQSSSCLPLLLVYASRGETRRGIYLFSPFEHQSSTKSRTHARVTHTNQFVSVRTFFRSLAINNQRHRHNVIACFKLCTSGLSLCAHRRRIGTQAHRLRMTIMMIASIDRQAQSR